MGTAIKHHVPDRVRAVICNFCHPGHCHTVLELV